MTSLHPAATGLDYLAEIALQSAALADAAQRDLDAPVEHCPGWSVAGLVEHVWFVHWFWGLIVEQRLSAPPQLDRPAPPEREVLIAEFRAGAARLVEILRAADQQQPVWTWAPAQQDVGFITRHQVQEAAVHRWDAEHATGQQVSLQAPMSVDSIEELLTFSVASPADPPATAQPSLGGAFTLIATDAEASWTVSDAELAGTIRFERGAVAGLPSISASASDLLLWLYKRVPLQIAAADPVAAGQLIDRFRALTFTD